MKPQSYIPALLLTVAILSSSCLDEIPRDQLPEEAAYSTTSLLYANTVATLYNYIGGTDDSEGLQGPPRGVFDFNTFTSDEAIIPIRGGDWYDGGFWRDLYLHNWTPYDEPFADTWNYLYKVVALSNRSLETLALHRDLLTDDEYNMYTAEVRAIRALFYYYICDLFGRVPIVTSTDVSIRDVKQSERSVVFRFIVDELTDVLPELSTARSTEEGVQYGHVTAQVAMFLLAKLALNASVYCDDDWMDGSRPDYADIKFKVNEVEVDALTACCEYCTILGQFYHLEEMYETNFSLFNEKSVENIFTIPMSKTLYRNQFTNLFRSRHYAHGAALGLDAENGPCATTDAISTYFYDDNAHDLRLYNNFFIGDVYVDGKPVLLADGSQLFYDPWAVTNIDLSGTPKEQTAGARMWKYEIDRTAYLDGKLQENDIVLFRYADVLLMLAEAKWRMGKGGAEELNMVYHRSNPSDFNKEINARTILDERLMELQWEGWRRQDMIRFGTFTDARCCKPADDGDNHTIVFPIPHDVRLKNTNLKQNPGYD